MDITEMMRLGDPWLLTGLATVQVATNPPYIDRGDDVVGSDRLATVGDWSTGVPPAFPQRGSRTSCALWNDPLAVEASGPISKCPHRSVGDSEEQDGGGGGATHPPDVLGPPSPLG